MIRGLAPSQQEPPGILGLERNVLGGFDSAPILGHIVCWMAGTPILIRGGLCELHSNARFSAPRWWPSARSTTHVVRPLVVGRPPRGSRSFVLYSLLPALYLVVALSVPGAFLIAKQATVGSSYPLILPAEPSFSEQHSSEQFGGNAGADGGQDSWPGPKRLRGILLSKIGIDRVLSSLIAPIASAMALLENVERKPVLSGEPQPPKDDLFAQESLGRSPPSGR